MKQNVHPKILVTLLCLLLFFYGFLLAGIQFVINDIALLYGAGKAKMGWMISTMYIVALVAAPLMGTVSDYVGKKKILIIFAFIFSLGCLAAGLSWSIGTYLIGAALIGAGYSVCETLASAVLTEVDPERGAQYMNLSQALFAAGAMVSPLILQKLMELLHADWRLVFALTTVAFAALAVALCFFRFPSSVPAGPAAHSRMPNLFHGVYVVLLIAIVLYVGLEEGFGYFVESLFSEKYGSGNFGAYAISAYWAGIALSRLLCSFYHYRPVRMVRICYLTCAAALAFIGSIREPWLGIVLGGLIGLAFGPIWATLMTLAAEQYPDHSGSAIGFMSTACGLGGVIYPPIMGAIAEQFSFMTAFWLLAATGLAGFLLCLTLKEKRTTNEISN